MRWMVDKYSTDYRQKLVKHFAKPVTFDVICEDVDKTIYDRSTDHRHYVVTCAHVLDCCVIDKKQFLVVLGTENDIELFKEFVYNDLPIWDSHPDSRFLQFIAMIISDEIKGYIKRNKRIVEIQKAKQPFIAAAMSKYFPTLAKKGA